MISVPSKRIAMEEANKEILKKIMTKDAIERLHRIKISSPIIASQLESYLIHVYQNGQLNGKITDEKLKQVAEILSPKRETIIKRKRK